MHIAFSQIIIINKLCNACYYINMVRK